MAAKGTRKRATSPKPKLYRKKTRKGGLKSVFSGNKSITSVDRTYVHHQGTQSALKCFECGGKSWMVNSFAFGGRVADAFNVDWITDKTYYAYTCNNCSEVRFKKNPLKRGDMTEAKTV